MYVGAYELQVFHLWKNYDYILLLMMYVCMYVCIAKEIYQNITLH